MMMSDDDAAPVFLSSSKDSHTPPALTTASHHPHNATTQQPRKASTRREGNEAGCRRARVKEFCVAAAASQASNPPPPPFVPPSKHNSTHAPPPTSSTIRARGSGSAGGLGGGTTGGSGINSGGSSPHPFQSTAAATAATLPPSTLLLGNSMGDWEELKRKVRGIESKLEEKCQAYSFLAQRMNSDLLYDEENPLLENSEEQSLATEIENLLTALSECNDAMGRLLAHGTRTSSSALLQRYREIFNYYTSEFHKTQVALQRKRESAELLKGGAGRGGGPGAKKGGEWGNPQMDQLLRERNAIHSSLRSVGNILSQAMETKDGLRAQRQGLSGANTGLAGLASNLPSISRVVDAIQRKKTRDNAIIGLIIAGCLCFTIWYLV